MKRTIAWFKTDLRIADNEMLLRAIAAGDEVIPVYCFDVNHYKESEFGFKKTGSYRANFILESVLNLKIDLESLGSGLVVVIGKPEEEFIKLVSKYKVNRIYSRIEVGPEEIQTLTKVKLALSGLDCAVETCGTGFLYDSEDLPFALSEVPEVFTNFRLKVEKTADIRLPLPSPVGIKSPPLPEFMLPDLSDLGLNLDLIDDRRAILFKGGSSAALERLEYYTFGSDLVSTYKESRNGMIGGDFSTKFSAWLSLGCISASYIVQRITEYEAAAGANDSTYWVKFELLWRDFFKLMMLKHTTKLFDQTGISKKPVDLFDINANLLYKWVNGVSGIDFVDANMLELKYTGFISNRGRQIVASYFCNDLKMDWRYGAAYFEQQLIDYDVSSNWCNWAYVAGVGNDPRKNRYFNIEKQAEVYDSDKAYRKLWLGK